MAINIFKRLPIHSFFVQEICLRQNIFCKVICLEKYSISLMSINFFNHLQFKYLLVSSSLIFVYFYDNVYYNLFYRFFLYFYFF